MSEYPCKSLFVSGLRYKEAILRTILVIFQGHWVVSNIRIFRSWEADIKTFPSLLNFPQNILDRVNAMGCADAEFGRNLCVMCTFFLLSKGHIPMLCSLFFNMVYMFCGVSPRPHPVLYHISSSRWGSSKVNGWFIVELDLGFVFVLPIGVSLHRKKSLAFVVPSRDTLGFWQGHLCR